MIRRRLALLGLAGGLAFASLTGTAAASPGCTGLHGQPINSTVCVKPENKPPSLKGGSKGPGPEDLFFCGVGAARAAWAIRKTANPGEVSFWASECAASLAWE